MKINSFSTKNIYENPTSYILKNSSATNINSSTPIKVRKKIPLLIKVKSYRLFKGSNKTRKTATNYIYQTINYDLFIAKYLFKYNSNPNFYYIKIANQLLFNFPNHLVSNFKDNLIWNENYDYIKNFYCLKKSMELLPKIGNYYETYTLIFPIYFPLKDLNTLISKFIKNKMKFFETTEKDEDFNDEIKDIDKNIIENNSNNEKNNMDLEKKEQDNLNKKKDNNEKLINTTEIKTENSCSLSNYFGLDSVIKYKDNSNFGGNNNFENQIINYSLLSKIKKNYTDKKKENKKDNLNYSLELAAIIQSFEENEQNYYKAKKKSFNSKTSKVSSKNKLFYKINKYNSNTTFCNKRYKNKKKIDISLKDKYKIYAHNSITKNNKILSPNNKNITKSKENKSILEKKIKNKSNDVIYEHHLTFNKEAFNNVSNKINNDIFYSENNRNFNYDAYHNNKKPNFLYKNIKMPLTAKIKNRNNSLTKKEIYKKLAIKSKENKIYKIFRNKSKSIDFRNNSKNNIYNANNLTFSNISNRIDTNKTKDNDYSSIKAAQIFIMQKNRKNTRNRKDNIGRSQSQREGFKKDLSHLNPKKLIFVNKKKEYRNSSSDKKYSRQNITLNSPYKESISSNGNNTLNKIFVNKKETLLKNIKLEKNINKPKNLNKIKIEEINNLNKNKSLNNYKNYIENEYNTFIPKLIIKKMFFNKLNNEKKCNKANDRNPLLKKHNISSRKNQNTYSPSNSNTSKINRHLKKLTDSRIPMTCSINKYIFKNKRALTEFNKLIKIFPKSDVQSPTKSGRQNKRKNIFKITRLSGNDKTPILKIKKKLFNDSNNSEKINTKRFKKILKEINNLKINKNLKKSFINKNSLMINVNIYNNFKINPEINFDKKKLMKSDIINHSLKP